MVSAIKKKDMYKGLKDNFLYKNDLNSIYILLAMYDIEENINNIFPKYMCLKDIKKRIKAVLRNRSDCENIAHNLSVVIHEDINRLELCFYIEGYRDGFNSLKYSNLLEKKIVEKFGLNYLYKEMFLNSVLNDYRTQEIKESIFKKLDGEVNKKIYIKQLIDKFVGKVIKKRILSLEKYIDKQLKFGFNNEKYSIIEINYDMNDTEVEKISALIRESLKKHLCYAYNEAFWNGMNDKVFRRYK